jgi:hypothetical protein
MPVTAWTQDGLAEMRAADWRYTRAWNKAMRAFDAERDMSAARAAYNAVMGPALAAWQREMAGAHALSEGAEF